MPLPSSAANLADFVLRQVNRLVTPESRRIAYTRIKQFAVARPLLFSFIVTQLAFAAMPLAFFVSFLFLVLVSASVFSLLLSIFWTGLALFFVVPVLALCVSVGAFSWAFGVVALNAARWFLAVGRTVVDVNAAATAAGRRRNRPAAASTPASSGGSSPRCKTVAGGDARRPAPARHPAPGSGVDSLEP